MSKLGTITLAGCSKKKYDFDIYQIGTKFKALGAVYFISKRDSSKTHKPIYLDITNDLSSRFNNHHKEGCIRKMKANCISVLLVKSENERKDIE